MMGLTRVSFRTRAVRAGLLPACLSFLVVAISTTDARGAQFTLIDDNSTAMIDTEAQAGVHTWTVGGISQVFQQWFWYRVGDGPEASIDTLLIDLEGTTDTNFDGDVDTLFVRYLGQGFEIESRFTLDGGLPGSDASDMAEQISINNTGDSDLDFHFFQYSDFDLEGDSASDQVVFTNANAVQQFKSNLRLTETVITPLPSHREADFHPTTLNSLNDGAATTLSDTPLGVIVGPGDVTWAYQWDFVLTPGNTFQISKDKNLSAIPEPSTFALAALAIAALAGYGRRRRRQV
ncbi:MAG: PEP-CTERM sorting domain-containing protein [Pirellulales bacterium]